jgi:hypothetical protein
MPSLRLVMQQIRRLDHGHRFHHSLSVCCVGLLALLHLLLQVGLLAAALICEAAGVPAAAGEVLDLLATAPGGRAGSVVRRSLLLFERLAFPLLRWVLWQWCAAYCSVVGQ